MELPIHRAYCNMVGGMATSELACEQVAVWGLGFGVWLAWGLGEQSLSWDVTFCTSNVKGTFSYKILCRYF